MARAYVSQLRDLIVALGVSEARMDQGNLRADVNLSLAPKGSGVLGTRTETKNVNSFRSVERAVRFEMQRHAGVLDAGGSILQETRHWHEDTGVTTSGREKSDADDYRYFPEPDLVPIAPPREWVEELRGTLPENPTERRARLQTEWGFSDLEMRDTVGAGALGLVEETIAAGASPQSARKWWLGELARRAVAAKEGGGDPIGNPALALAIQKAKDASMPKDNIERAIAKGTGAGADAEAFEAVLYEGYGPGGVALLVETLTDNRNRTGSDVRHLLSKHGGNLGEPGSVAYLFDKKGVIVVDAEKYSEDDLLVAIEAGAEDIGVDDDVFEIVTEPGDLAAVREALEAAGIEFQSAEVTQQPKTRVPLDEDTAGKLMRLIDALEDNDDVGEVHANFDVDADVLERVAG